MATPSNAATVDIDASAGGTQFQCCGSTTSTDGYLTPLYTFDGGTTDFGSVVLFPYVESVGPSVYQVFMGSVTSSLGPITEEIPTVLYGDLCVETSASACNNLYLPPPITVPLVFAFPDAVTSEFQLAFLGSYQYIPPTATPAPDAWLLMLTGLLIVGFAIRRPRWAPTA